MAIVVVERPEPFISLELAKHHLMVRHDDDDTLIGAYIRAVCRHIDGPNTWLGHAIGPQLVEVRQPDWGDFDPLPCQPLIEVQAVTYVGTDGSEGSIDPDDYEATTRGICLRGARPALRGDREGVRVLCRVGYEDGGPSGVPDDIIAAALLMVGDLYANRETGVQGTVSVEVKMAPSVEALLAPYLNWNR